MGNAPLKSGAFLYQCCDIFWVQILDLVLVFQHPVTDADLGKYIFRLGGILFDLAADVCHIYAQDLVVVVHIRSPDGIHDEAVGQYSAGILS